MKKSQKKEKYIKPELLSYGNLIEVTKRKTPGGYDANSMLSR